jgi:hypothetical protein
MSRKDEDSELGFWSEPITRDQMRAFWNELGKVSTYPGEAEWLSRLVHSAKNKSTTFVVKGSNMHVEEYSPLAVELETPLVDCTDNALIKIMEDMDLSEHLIIGGYSVRR